MDNKTRAQQIFDQNQPAVEQARKFGISLSPIMAASVEDIQAHLDLVDEIAREFGFSLDASKIQFGASREQIVSIAQAKARNYKNRAGVRALEQKYGHEAAARIVKKYSGRTIR
jgi:hypothetical protein